MTYMQREGKKIIIKDLAELGTEGDNMAIEEILRQLSCQRRSRQITYVRRLGQNRSRKRPLMVSFTSEEAVKEIYRNRDDLTYHHDLYKVTIMKDLPRSERGKHSKISNVLNEAASENGPTNTVNHAQANNNQINLESSASITQTTDTTGGMTLVNCNTPVRANKPTNTMSPIQTNANQISQEVSTSVTTTIDNIGGPPLAIFSTPVSSRLSEISTNISRTGERVVNYSTKVAVKAKRIFQVLTENENSRENEAGTTTNVTGMVTRQSVSQSGNGKTEKKEEGR